MIGFTICHQRKKCITDFSGAIKRLLYRVNQNQDQGPITLGVTSLDRFDKFKKMNNFCCTFLKNCKGNNVETWCTYGEWVDVSCIPESGLRAHNSWS